MKGKKESKPSTWKSRILSESSSLWLMIIGLVVIGVGILLFLNGDYSSIELSSKIKSDKVGQFGDFIGGLVGSLWALAGVILFYLALEKQKEALDYQKREFRLQREELEKTREVFEKQNETQEFLQYESSFFSLIDLRQSIVDNFSLNEKAADHGLVTLKGQAAIKKIADRVLMLRRGTDNDKAFSNLFDRNSGYLIPYFNLMTEIMVKIEHCPFDDKTMYFTDIFYSLFSDNELIIIGQYRANQSIDYRFDKLYKGSEIGS